MEGLEVGAGRSAAKWEEATFSAGHLWRCQASSFFNVL